MRLTIVIILALFAGWGVLQVDQSLVDNYAQIYVAGHVVEAKLIPLMVLIALITLALYVCIRLFRLVWKSPKTLGKWNNERVSAKADTDLGDGYLSLVKGDWAHAEKKLVNRATHARVPYVNYLAAAQAAQEQSQIEKRDEYLNLAYKAAPKERLAIGLTKARLHFTAGQYEQALATLNDIAKEGKKNAQYFAMLLQTHQALENWQEVHNVLPLARKAHALPEQVLEEADTQAHFELLKGANGVAQTWKELPKAQQKKPENIALYCQSLIADGNLAAAEKLIRTTLKNQWSEELVSIYGGLQTDKPAKLRRQVEGWLNARPESAELNLAAGRLAMQEQNTELAQNYLEKAIQLNRDPRAYALLGELYENNNDSGRALQLYRAGMSSAANQHDRSNQEKLTDANS